ncbi:MAG TPA: thioredoxin domain-containing protein [Pyrinomonadaceae bacterium]|nr:thioredoxin domain-containing protein [Pyrinomonadaceae bacterium]
MENEILDEGQVPAPSQPATTPTPPPRTAPEKRSSGGRDNLTIALVMFLILVNIAVLYITNSRITDLEKRVAQVSLDAKAAKSGPAPRPGAPNPGQTYTVDTQDAPFTGPESAPITIVEASDFECPFCAKVQPTLAKVKEVYKDNVRIVWKNLPLSEMHPNALPAAMSAEAAKKQGKFWEYHDKLFANQKKLSGPDLRRYAQEVGLDMTQFDADVADPTTRKRVTDDTSEINALGVTGTPAFFINGRFLNGAQPFEAFANAINSELKRLNLPAPSE